MMVAVRDTFPRHPDVSCEPLKKDFAADKKQHRESCRRSGFRSRGAAARILHQGVNCATLGNCSRPTSAWSKADLLFREKILPTRTKYQVDGLRPPIGRLTMIGARPPNTER